MVYKNFRFKIIVRISFIILSIFLLFFVIYNMEFNITPVLIIMIVAFQVFSLIHFLESTNRYLTNFLESIRYSDFTRSFQVEGLGAAYDGLKEAFNDVINDFQQIRTEKEVYQHYLQNVIQHIGICLIVFKKNGDVLMINNAAKKLFRINKLKNINSLDNFSPALFHLILVWEGFS